MTEPSTRERLLDAAERLFAQEGVDAVSMRRIATEAGQRNNAALHYHFGDREALLTALVERRAHAINARRRELLAQLDAAGPGSLRELVHAWVAPNADLLRDPNSGGGFHLRFLSQLFSHGRADGLLAGDLPMPVSAPVFEVVSRIEKCLPHLPHEVFAQRARLAATQIVHACASEAQALERVRGKARKRRIDRFVSGLVDFLAGALAGPQG